MKPIVVPKRRYGITTTGCVITEKSAVLMHTTRNINTSSAFKNMTVSLVKGVA